MPWVSIIGSLAWPAIKNLIPWAGPRTTLAAIGLLLGVIAIGVPTGTVWIHMRALRTAAVNAAVIARDTHWQTEITKANQTHAEKLEAARRAAERVAGTPDDRAQRLRLCQQSPTCRDRRR